MQEHFIAELLKKYHNGTSTAAEEEQLMDLLAGRNLQDEFKETMTAEWEKLVNADTAFTSETGENILKKIIGEEEEDISGLSSGRINFIRTTWFRYAAILLLTAGAGIYLYLKTGKPQKETAFNQNLKQSAIKPGGDKAILTLSDGRIIVLDSAASGPLVNEGNTKIMKLDGGSLAYQAGEANGEALYNTISTPKGGQYQIILPDGSIVWLNAASSITFPAAFTKERKVTITGEVYLEVAQDKAKPFYVQTGEMTLQVLGTSFNINAYPDETSIKTTLIDGKVRVNAYKNTHTLEPGQQAEVLPGEVKLIKNADLDKVMAWKNGWFNFDNAGLGEVMRQLSRWYNVDVVYEKGIPNVQFWGGISRNTNLQDVLKALEKSDIHFRVEGKQLIIMP